MGIPPLRVMVVDDYEVWRRFLCSSLQRNEGLQIVAEASDGHEALSQAQLFQPDLIFLDIGLPKLNGIEVARQIPNISPQSKVVFVSQNHDVDIIQEALGTGALGYLLKSSLTSDLPSAVDAVLLGTKFVSCSLTPS
jgi:DNA-binding NarL/FixJ family response regulator